VPSTATPWWRTTVGIVIFSGQTTAAYVHPAILTVLAIANATVPPVAGVVVVTVILFGSEETNDRIFRLLRWIANRPEPPAPPDCT
jgi:hypothetical protein